jgi:hypothetical protein
MVIKVSLVHNPLNTPIMDHSRCLHWWVCLLTTGQTSGCIVGVSPSGCIRGVFSGCILNTGYCPPGPIRRIERTYSRRRKQEALLFLVHHRIPMQVNYTDKYLRPSRVLKGMPDVKEEGFRLSRELATWHCSDLAATLWRTYSD